MSTASETPVLDTLAAMTVDSIERCGLSAGVYTQIIDVEHEVNGFLTYDRRVRKLDFDEVRAVNEQITRPDPSARHPTVGGCQAARGSVVGQAMSSS